MPDSAEVSDSRPRLAFPLAAVVLAIALAAAVATLGPRQFGAGDYGSYSVNAWFLHLGYRAYVDVVTPYPPLFLLGAKWAFDLFGVRWLSMVDAAAIFSAATFLAQVWLLFRLRLGRAASLGIATAVQIVSVLPMSVWAYNPETAVCAALFVSAAALLHDRPGERSSRVAFAATAAALALSKPNVAGLILAGVAVAHLVGSARAIALPLLVATAGGVVAALFLLHVDVAAMVRVYRTVSSSRVGSTREFFRYLWWNDARWEAPNTVAALAPLVAAALLGARETLDRSGRKSGDGRAFRMALAAIASVGMTLAWVTDHELKMSATPPFLVAVSVWLLRLEKVASPRSLRAMVVTSLAALAAYGGQISCERKRVFAIGPHLFYEDAPLTRVERPPFFAGVLAPDGMREVLDRLDEILRARGFAGRLDAPVIFGPRLEFGYAAWGIRPVPGLPLVWDFYPDGAPRTEAALRLFDAHAPQLLVLLVGDRDEMSSYPPELRQYLSENYTSRLDGQLRLLERRR